MILRYRRGGNRPITRRLLICWAQTAAVLPPMRNPRFIQQVYVYASNSRSRGFDSPLDSRWDIRSGMAFFIPSRALIRPASLFFSFFLPQYLLPTRCSDKTFLNWVSLEGDVCPRFFWKQSASTSSIIYWFSFFCANALSAPVYLICTALKLLLLLTISFLLVFRGFTKRNTYTYKCTHTHTHM